MKNKFARVKMGCYTTNITMALVGNLPPILFLTFKELYGISFSLLGLLVLINFTTQLMIDLIFSFFSHLFNIKMTIRLTPVFSAVGLLIFALAPNIFPNHTYIGLVIGTVIFSLASGLSEVLMSPTIAAIPADNPEREMSKLHSIYAWGVVFVVALCTLFFLIFDYTAWQYLTLIFMTVPILACILFLGADIPDMETPERASGAFRTLFNREVMICVLAIFLGGATECTMAQWCSSYLEGALGIPKVWGDLFGVALFALMLGVGRSLYAKRGKNVEKVLLIGASGAVVCYLVAIFSPLPIIGLIACAMTGLAASMLWPGSLIAAENRLPSSGVIVYAIMAAGGDLGASLSPQLVGIVADAVAASEYGISMATRLGFSPEVLGLKSGMLIATIFPIIAVGVFLYILKTKKKKAD